MKWVRDSDYNGEPDKWIFFKNGKVFLEESDTDGDSKADMIYIDIFNETQKKRRKFAFAVSDKERNIFVETGDTGWKDVVGQEE